jgi:nucleoside phosphorylase
MPKVHHGSIGSADISVRDATTRDELAARHGFLAVEMEGAGIGRSSFLNGKEWFVVRGISDYGDGYRDDAWRRYGSLTAAAYVRSLLAKCLPLKHAAVSG